MATLILAGIGSAFNPAAGFGIGSALGGLAGSYIDNTYLFPPPDQKGPRLDDLALQSASEGSPCMYPLGQENRTTATIIWMSKAKEHRHSTGKGGPKVETYSYTIDVAVEFARCFIDGVDKMWWDGALLYDDTPNLSVSSNQLSLIKTPHISLFDPDNPITAYWEDVTSPNGGPDLSVFRSGIDVVISGFANALNNGTFQVISATMDDATGISTLRVLNSACVAASASPTISLTQSPPKFSPSSATSFTFYNGSTTQTPDPTMESYLGTGNVSAYRGKAYVVIQGLLLRGQGGAMPQFSGMVRRTAIPQSVGSCISELVVRAGRSTSEIDVSTLTTTMKGYAIRGVQDTLATLQPLLVGFDVLTQEDNAVVRFFSRTAPTAVTIPITDFAAHEPGEEMPRPIKFRDTFTGRLPNEVNVGYLDPVSDYQAGSQRERRADLSPIADVVLRIDLPLVMSATDARALAKRTLWAAWGNRHTANFSLPPSWLEVLENDLVVTTFDGVEYRLLVTQIDLGANGLLQVEAVTEETQALTQTATAEPGGAAGGGSTVFFPPATLFSILSSCGPLRDEEIDLPGFYWAGCYADPSEPFFGSDLFQSQDLGVNYSAVQHMESEAVIGRATTALATAKTCYIDYKSTVTVKLVDPDDSLDSISELECLNGANRALIGAEVVGFITATLIGTGTYTLSGLLRGLRNTEDYTTGHAIGDPFVLLEESSLNFLQLPLSAFQTERMYKLVAQGGTVGTYASEDFTVTHPTLRPFPPCDVYGTRNNSNADILVSWKRRTRTNARVFGGTGMPLADTSEIYNLEVWNTAETILRDTVQIIGATSFNYTAAMQTASSLTPGAAMHIRLYQYSTLIGRSYANVVTV